MARKLKTGDKLQPKPGNNGFDPEDAERFATQILAMHTKLEEVSGTIRAEIKSVYSDAKAAGIPKAIMKEAITLYRHEQKAEKRRDDLDVDYPNQLDNLRHALGWLEDTPLGKAAMKDAAE